MENLFDNPTTLRDPADFVGRQEQLERIFGLIKGRQSISLVGLRRIGKTSLLTCLKSAQIQQKFKFDGDRFLFLYLDLQTRSMKEQVDFFDDVHRTLKEFAEVRGDIIAEEGEKDDEINELLAAFDRQGMCPVLILDAFDEISQYQEISENVFSFLRSLATRGHISYITASVETIGEIFRKLVPVDSKPSPLYNIFASVKLTALTLPEARMLLSNTSEKSGLPFSEEEIAWVVRIAGLHPFLLQRVAALFFEEKKRAQNTGEIDYAYVQKEAYQSLYDYFEDCWMMFSPADRQTVITDILQFEEDRQARRSYPELCSSKLFSDYLRATGKLVITPPPLPLPRINAKDIGIIAYKKLLNRLNDSAALGESAFIGIPLIRTQIEQQQANLPTVRGRIVESVLREALERMGGQGNRSDEDRSWVYYNILYYRYFMLKHDMSQEIVASRLLISERQYYRLSPKALERLRNELLAMDAAVVHWNLAFKQPQPSAKPQNTTP